MVSKWERWATLSGALAVPFWVASVALISTKVKGSKGPEILTHYQQHSDGILAAGLLWAIGTLLFIWFLGSLRSALRVAEGGTGRVSSVAFAGGVVSASAFFAFVTLIAGAAFHPDQSTPEVTRAINDLAVVSAGPALAGLTALFAASAKVAFRHGAFSPAIGWLLALAAFAQLFAVGAMLTDSGAFAGDGVLGFALPIVGFAVAILVLSGALVRRAGRVDQPVAG